MHTHSFNPTTNSQMHIYLVLLPCWFGTVHFEAFNTSKWQSKQSSALVSYESLVDNAQFRNCLRTHLSSQTTKTTHFDISAFCIRQCVTYAIFALMQYYSFYCRNCQFVVVWFDCLWWMGQLVVCTVGCKFNSIVVMQ